MSAKAEHYRQQGRVGFYFFINDPDIEVFISLIILSMILHYLNCMYFCLLNTFCNVQSFKML